MFNYIQQYSISFLEERWNKISNKFIKEFYVSSQNCLNMNTTKIQKWILVWKGWEDWKDFNRYII